VLAPAHRLAAPRAVNDRQLGVEVPPARHERAAGRREVVGSPTHTEAERQPTAGELVDARRRLRQQQRRVDRGQQDVGHQADPAGGTGRCGQ